MSLDLKTTHWQIAQYLSRISIWCCREREFSESPEKIRIHVFLENWRNCQKSKEVIFSPGEHRNIYLGTQSHKCLKGGSSLAAGTWMFWRDMLVRNMTCKEMFQKLDLFSLERRRLIEDNQAFLPCIKGYFRDDRNQSSPVALRVGQEKKMIQSAAGRVWVTCSEGMLNTKGGDGGILSHSL